MEKYLSVEISKCTNCGRCALWCSFTKVGECGPAYARIKLYTIVKEGITIPIFCNHCDTPYCMVVCPAKALHRDPETGAVLHNDERCIGCRTCILACPFGAISLQPDGKVIKCDLCKGLPEPACVAHCPQNALIWEKPELLSRSKQRAYSQKLIELSQPSSEEKGPVTLPWQVIHP